MVALSMAMRSANYRFQNSCTQESRGSVVFSPRKMPPAMTRRKRHTAVSAGGEDGVMEA